MAYPFAAVEQNPDQRVVDDADQVNAEPGKTRSYTPRHNPGGNFVGHKPDEPRFVSTVSPYEDEGWDKDCRDSFGHKRKSSFFYDADAKLREFYRFPKTIPGLGILHSVDGQSRQHRSEFREESANLLTALIHHLELASVNWDMGFARVGYASEFGFEYYDNKYWKDKTGLSDSQLKRTFSKLQEKGYITRKRRWVERDKGRFKGLATMTLIHLDLFREMGLIESLRDASAYAYKALKEAATKIHSSVSKMLRCLFDRPSKPKEPRGQDKPTDFPANNPRHWELKLKSNNQREAFRHRYLRMMAEQGDKSDYATIYREAYLSVTRME